MKKITILFSALLLSSAMFGQVLYSENFSGLTLNSAGAAAVPTNMQTINADGLAGNTATNDPPFNAAPFTTSAWAAFTIGTDTVAVSTSWTTTAAATVDRWLITPPISGVTASTVLAWDAEAPDASYPDGYEVWVSVAAGANAGTVLATDFTAIPANEVYNIASEGSGAFVSHNISLASFAGQTVRVAFRNHSTDMFHLYIDNIVVVNPASKEVAALSIANIPSYALVGTQTVNTVMSSHGGATVATATLQYSVDGGAPVSQTFSPNIGYGGTYTAVFTTPTASLAAGLHNIKSWISDVNGTGLDITTADDTAYWNLSVMTTAPIHNVLLEEFTGVGCGYCPQGAVSCKQEIATDPKVVCAAIHETGQGADNMNIADGTTVTNTYDTGDPSYTLDRSDMGGSYGYNAGGISGSTDLMDFTPIATRETSLVPATVSLTNVSFTSGTRTISATVNANFACDVIGTFALNCYVIENRVYGPVAATTDNGWNQHSYFFADNVSQYYNIGSTTSPWSGGSSGVAGLFPLVYQHEHVVEKMIGGPWGDNTVIPTTLVSSGSTLNKTFTWTLPAANPGGAHQYNDNNIYIIGILQEYSSTGDIAHRSILNVVQQKLTAAPESGLSMTGVEEVTTDFGTVSVYPNPASTLANIAMSLNSDENVTVNIYNALGAIVYSENNGKLSAGEHLININTEHFANGIYNVTINTGKGMITKKVVINK